MTTKTEMSPRERVMVTLDLREPDRVPIDFAQAGGDGITAVAYQRLIKHLKLPPREGRIMNKLAQSVHVEEDVLQRFRVDFRRVDMGAPDNWQDEPVGDDGYRDEWGVIRVRPEGSYYYDLAESPMKNDTMDVIDRHPWPDPDDPGRYRGLGERARKLHEDTDYAVVLNVNCAFFLRCAELRGWENFYMDMAGNPTFAYALMEKYLDIRLRMAERALEEVGEHIDIVFATSDDLGMTDRLIVSPEMYRQLIKPLQKKTFDFFKDRTTAKRFFHCDGALYPIIEDFIEIGVEVLNPIQVNCVGMSDTKKLKQEFGDRLAFWGAIDTSQVLPLGTTEDVCEEVRLRIADLAPGGGYVLCSVHNIQPEVPPENVVAMFDAAYELGAYPLQTR